MDSTKISGRVTSTVKLGKNWLISGALSWLIACFPHTAIAQSAEFEIHAEEPVFARQAGGWDSAYVDPGTVLYHEGAFHMFYVAIPRWPHPLAIGYAKSDDGFDWDRQSDQPILTHDQTGPLNSPSIMSTSALVTDDGTWVLYFTSVATGENFYGSIGRATAPGPLGPWVVDPDPVLMPGPSDAWDGLSIGDASVVQTSDGYALYYAGFGNFKNGALSEKRSHIGMATSPDGVTWTKFDDPETTDAYLGDSDPILPVTADDLAWDSFRLVDPNVQATADGWTMVYRGASFNSGMAVGIATSADGVKWHRSSDQPIFSKAGIGLEIFFSTWLSRPERDFLFMELGSLDRTDAYVATRSRISD